MQNKKSLIRKASNDDKKEKLLFGSPMKPQKVISLDESKKSPKNLKLNVHSDKKSSVSSGKKSASKISKIQINSAQKS